MSPNSFIDPQSLAAAGRLKAPHGKFRVVGVDTFEGPTADYLVGDFGTSAEAIQVAHKNGGEMNICYVYDDTGEIVFTQGTL